MLLPLPDFLANPQELDLLPGHFGSSFLLEVSLCFRVAVHGRFELQDLIRSSPRTVIRNILNCNLNFDSCGQGSNSNFSSSFLFEVLSSASDRVSDKAVAVDGTCSHGLPSAGLNGGNGESTFSVGDR